jgi:hypothetical protein
VTAFEPDALVDRTYRDEQDKKPPALSSHHYNLPIYPALNEIGAHVGIL